jgi:dTDP-4-amino-4,6-dideoxygalactose transaminase
VPPERRDSMLHSLQEREVGVAVNFRAIHLLKYYREKFKYKKGDFPVAEQIGGQTISLPLYPMLRDDEVDYVIKSVLEAIKT